MVEKKKKSSDQKGNGVDKGVSLFDGGINKSYVRATAGADANNLRNILPAFIRNEQEHSLVDRRKIHSSPIKLSRRFSQDSQTNVQQWNVSFLLFETYLQILITTI